MKLLPGRGGRWQRELTLMMLLVGITALVASIDHGFLQLGNLRDILVRAAAPSIVACGVMLVVLTGEIDISVGSLMALLAAILGLAVSEQQHQLPVSIGVVLVLATGTVIGAITGLLVTLGRVPSILVTLGLLTMLRGVTTMVMRGENIDGLPETLTEPAKYGACGLPLGVWVAPVAIGVTLVIAHATELGRQIYAVGSSRYATQMLGLPERRIKWFVFAYTGFLTGLATLVEVPRLPTIESGIGQGFELLVITAVVVGGVSILGGRGRLVGVVLAVLLLMLIRPALTFLDIGEQGEKWSRAIQGAMILVAVVADRLWQGDSGGAL